MRWNKENEVVDCQRRALEKFLRSLFQDHRVREVKNLPDGRVHLVLQGEQDEVEEFLKAIRESSLSGHISSEQKTEMTTEGSPRLRGFKITR